MKKSIKNTVFAMAMCALLCGSMTAISISAPVPQMMVQAASPDASAKSILNSAKLSPQKTGYKKVDDKVQALLDQFRKEGATDTYSQVKACYDWLIKNTSYGYATNSMLSATDKEFGQPCYSPDMAYMAMGPLFDGVGVCDNYTAAFVVMTRAIGLESYSFGGQTRKAGGGYTGHAWAEITINGTDYIFDAQVEDNVAGSGAIRYLYFCKTETQMKNSYIWASAAEIEKMKKQYQILSYLQANYDYVVANISELQSLVNSQKMKLADKTITFRQAIDRTAVENTLRTYLPGADYQVYTGFVNDCIAIKARESVSNEKFTLQVGESDQLIVSNIPDNVGIRVTSSNPSVVGVQEENLYTSDRKQFKITALKHGLSTLTVTGSDGFEQTVLVSVPAKDLPLSNAAFSLTEKVGKNTFVIKGASDPSGVTFQSDDPQIQCRFVEKTSDGLKYEISSNTTNYGLHNVFVTYGGKTSSLEVTVSPIRGSIMLDTVNYKMSPGNIYDIGITVTKGEKQKLTGSQVKQLVDDGVLRVSDSRSGSIVNLTQLPNGNFRVTGKNPGTCYIVYEIVSQGQAVTHASVRVDVQNNIKQSGVATRHTSYWTPDLFSKYQW